MGRKLLIAGYVVLGGFCFCLFLANFRGSAIRDSRPATPRAAVAIRLVQAPAAETEKAKKAADRLETAPAPAIGDGGLGTVPAPRKFTWTELENEFARLRADRKERPEAMHELSAWYEHVADPKFTESKNYLDHIERLKSWHDEKPDSSTRLVVLAKAYINFAWSARGTGFAGTVTDEGWLLFHGRISEAQRLLEQALDKGVKDGEAYALLIEIAKVEVRPKEEALEWLKAGQKLDASYAWMYAKMAEYLLPRWNGEPGEIERFAAETTKQVPGDDGLDAFAHVVWQVHRYDRRTLWWGEYDRTLLGKAAKVLATRYPNTPRLVSFAALCAYAAQDQATARELKEMVGKFNEKDGIWPWFNTYDNFVEWTDGPDDPKGEDHWIWAATTGGPEIGFTADASALWCPQQYGGDLLNIEVKSGQILEQMPGPGGLLNQIEFDNARNWIVASYWRGPFTGWTLWDLKAQDSQPHPTDEQVRALAIHPTAKRIACAESMTVRIIDLETGQEVNKFSLPDYVHQLEFSPSGQKLYVKTGKKNVCDPENGEILYELPNQRLDPKTKLNFGEFAAFDEQNRMYGTAFDLSLSPIKKCLVRGTADGKSWDILLTGLDFGSGTAGLSPDRRRLALANTSGKGSAWGIELWDVPGAKRVARLGGHWTRIGSLQFSDDGSKLASRAHDVVKIWNVPAADSK